MRFRIWLVELSEMEGRRKVLNKVCIHGVFKWNEHLFLVLKIKVESFYRNGAISMGDAHVPSSNDPANKINFPIFALEHFPLAPSPLHGLYRFCSGEIYI